MAVEDKQVVGTKRLNEGDIGRRVVYRTSHAVEVGEIYSWNREYVFVNYGHGPQATRPEDLEWEFGDDRWAERYL